MHIKKEDRSMDEFRDDELLERFRDEGSRSSAFNTIVERYKERLYWHIRKIVIVHEDADDVVQNTFMKAWIGVETFKGEAKLYTWLYRIATNEAINFLNQKRSVQMMPLEDAEYLLSDSLQNEELFSGDEMQKRLQKAILTLPEKQRIVFNMRFFDEMSYEDISEIVGTSVGALKSSHHIAMKKIKEWFEANKYI